MLSISNLGRRQLLLGAALPLLACQPVSATAHISGGFTGIAQARGHMLRASGNTWAAPVLTRSTGVLIAGAGVAGLAAARALRQKGVEDFVLLELEDAAGGNSRGTVINGIACPQGAHYLPLPGDEAWEVQHLLEEFGLRSRQAGRWVYDERHLCHSPQERLFFNGAWQEGLLPTQGVGNQTLAQYRQFAVLVDQAQRAQRWTVPAAKSPVTQITQALSAITFESYLNQHGLTDQHLRWYLNYCCTDDYGAGLASVSAWAGLHYFASRHGFVAPGMDSSPREGLLTWPQGNAWLTQRLAAPLEGRLHTGQVVLRVASAKHGVVVDVFNLHTQAVERWQARRAILALPVLVAARVVENPPQWLTQVAARTRYAPWLVANLHLSAALQDLAGAAPSWDNVLYGSTSLGLGYVDAQHQSLQAVPAATVLTHYRALGDASTSPQAARQRLQQRPWAEWRDLILAELSLAHPDLLAKTTRIDITRYGHAMAVPIPDSSGKIGLQRIWNKGDTLQKAKYPVLRHENLTFAHSDWAGYSVFEEAFTLGHHAA